MSERWRPDRARQQYKLPAVGDLIAFQHAAWRVMEIRPRPEDLWTDEEREAVAAHYRPDDIRGVLPCNVVVRPAGITGDDPKLRRHDRHLRVPGGRRVMWAVYPDEHYPVCAQCGDPTPCRERSAKWEAEEAVKKMGRYETAGVCPACQEPVTRRQKTLTFPDNLEIPGGPPVTFHLRSDCWSGAMRYEQRWVAADPERRRLTLSCPGRLTNHNDGTYDCTELGHCPSPTARHPSYARCRCPDCHSREWTWGNGCHPDPAARLNLDDAA